MKNTKKGFTLVELLVVIAILAILATVSVVGYTNFVEKANRSADQQLVAQLNVVVVGYLVENPNPTSQDILAQLAQNGVTNFQLAHKGHTMHWDAQTQRIVLVEGNQIVYPEQCKRAISNDEISAMPLIRHTPNGEVYFELLVVSVNSQNKVDQQVTFGSNSTFAKAVVPTGVQVNDGAQTLSLAVALAEMQADVEMTSGQVSYSLDVHVEGVSSNNTVPVLVTLNNKFPTDLASYNVKLFHVENGQTIAMTAVESLLEVDCHNEFFYDAETGDVTLAMASFSEVTAVVAVDNPWNGTAVDASWYNKDATEFVLYNAEQFAGFAQIVGGMANGIESDSFAGKTVKLGADLNMGSSEGVVFAPVGYYFTNDYDEDGTPNENAADIYSTVYSFEGTFDGQGHVISNVYQSTWEILGDDKYYSLPSEQYYNDGMGVFGFVYNGTIQNLVVNNFQSDGEFCTTGCVSAYSAGVSTFQNIRITNSNPRAYNVPNGGVVGYAYDEEGVENRITFNNIIVDDSTKISALWGSWDVSCGGILGRMGDATIVNMTDCTVAAEIDVYNDVCGNYQYYQFRYSGMLIGTAGSDEDPTDQIANATFSNCHIRYGEWKDHYYCELVANSLASYTHDHQMSRLEKIKYIFEITQDGGQTWLKAGNFLLDGECYHIVNNGGVLTRHMHENSGTEVVDGVEVLKEDKQLVHIPFNQLYTGYGWGSSPQAEGTNVSEFVYSITYMQNGKVLDVVYVTDNGNAVSTQNANAVDQVVLPENTAFSGWVNAGSIAVDTVGAGNTANITLYPTWVGTVHTARFVDQHGNVLYEELFETGATSLNYVPAVPEIELCNGAWEDYTEKLKNAEGDITIRPVYTINSNQLTATGIDADGDGVVDYYEINTITELGANVTIPGYINGVPCKVINDFAEGTVEGVQKIVIEEGVEILNNGAFAYTIGLTEVYLPSTITYLGENAFSRQGQDKKTEFIIYYNGTQADWEDISKQADWDKGMREGCQIVCSDSTATLSKNGNWTWTPNSTQGN